MTTEFSPEIQKKLNYYVYRLIDPRNGETFYIGKGKGNRVFSHVQGTIKEDSLCEKMSRIREINITGFEVAHVIHRHGMDESTAFEVEAALIDAYSGLTNILDGHGNSDCGVMHADEIIKRYSAETAEFEHKAILISINRSATEISMYEATRYAWRLNKRKAEQAEIILPTMQGLIVGAFIAEKWLEATAKNFPSRGDAKGRFGFIGKEASPELLKLYKNKRVPDEYRKRGASNPIKYSWS